MAQTPYNAPVGVAYSHISNAGTTLVKSVPGAAFSLNINSGTGVGSLTLFDQSTTATGTVTIAVINVGTANVLPQHLDLGPSGGGLNFKTGLVVVSTGTIDATVGFR